MSQTAPTTEARVNTMCIIAIVCVVIAVLILPIVFGPVGIVLGVIGKTRHEKLSTIAIVVAAAGMVIGFILGAIIMNQMGLA